MIVVIFEVWPKDGSRRSYLDIATRLRPMLDGVDGFISVERLQSQSTPGKLLSLSFFRDEAAMQAWRNAVEHRRAQSAGHGAIFADRRLRIASVVRDNGMTAREQAPDDSRSTHGA